MRSPPDSIKHPLRWFHRLFGFRLISGTVAFQIGKVVIPTGDWRWFGGEIIRVFAYYCQNCGLRLTQGPRGGSSCNCVCEKCKVNYGSLPNNEFE